MTIASPANPMMYHSRDGGVVDPASASAPGAGGSEA